MFLTVDGIVIDFNSLQPANACSPKYSTPSGITIVSSDLQLWKASESIPITFLGILISFNASQFSKVFELIKSISCGS